MSNSNLRWFRLNLLWFRVKSFEILFLRNGRIISVTYFDSEIDESLYIARMHMNTLLISAYGYKCEHVLACECASERTSLWKYFGDVFLWFSCNYCFFLRILFTFLSFSFSRLLFSFSLSSFSRLFPNAMNFCLETEAHETCNPS